MNIYNTRVEIPRKARKIPKDHKGLYLAPPFNFGKQTNFDKKECEEIKKMEKENV